MKGVARRVREWDGTRIRTDSVDHFVADMVQAGLLRNPTFGADFGFRLARTLGR